MASDPDIDADGPTAPAIPSLHAQRRARDGQRAACARVDLAALTLEQQRAAVEAGVAAPPDGITVDPIDADGVPCEWVAAHRSDGGRTIVGVRGGGYCLGSLGEQPTLLRPAGRRDRRPGPERRVPHRARAPVPGRPRRRARRPTAGCCATGPTRCPSPSPATRRAAGWSSPPCWRCATQATRCRRRRSPCRRGPTSRAPGGSLRSNAATEVMLDPLHLPDTAALYVDDELLRHPYVSPLYGDLHDLPPLLLHVGDGEILRDDATRFAARARDAGVDVTIDIVDGVPSRLAPLRRSRAGSRRRPHRPRHLARRADPGGMIRMPRAIARSPGPRWSPAC